MAWKISNLPTSDWRFNFYNRHSDWLNFRNFPENKLKIKIILRLTKRGDQAVISISTIQKFSAQVNEPFKFSSFVSKYAQLFISDKVSLFLLFFKFKFFKKMNSLWLLVVGWVEGVIYRSKIETGLESQGSNPWNFEND